MPGLSGLQTLKRLKKFNPSIKVIMISAEYDRSRERTAAQLGAAAFMHKPFSVDQVDAVLHQLYGLPMPMLKAPPAEIEMPGRGFVTELQPLRTIGKSARARWQLMSAPHGTGSAS